MIFYNIAKKDIRSFMKNPYITPLILTVHFLQFIISINVFENFIGQAPGSESYAIIEVINQGKSPNVVIFYASYILTQLITLCSIIIATNITAEWENKTIQRMLASPLGIFQVNLGIFSGYMVVMIIISGIFMLITSFIYGFHWGGAYLKVFLITLSLAFVCVSFAMLLSNTLRQTKLVAGISTFSVVAMNFISGGIFAGAAFNKYSKYTISRWAFDAYISVIEGKPLSSVLSNLCYIFITGFIIISIYILIVWKGDRYE